MWTRMWTRRVLDEEEQLVSTFPQHLKEELEEMKKANLAAAEALDERESVFVRDRFDAGQWLVLCRMTEGSDEVRGIEALLETLTGLLKVVYTVALDEVKQFVDRWAAGSADQGRSFGASYRRTAAPLGEVGQACYSTGQGGVYGEASGLMLTDEDGRVLSPGDPSFYKRKARLVICGNFQGKQSQEESYAGGCQTDSLRVMLVRCAALGWHLASTDIRNAFILAPIQEENDDEEAVYAFCILQGCSSKPASNKPRSYGGWTGPSTTSDVLLGFGGDSGTNASEQQGSRSKAATSI